MQQVELGKTQTGRVGYFTRGYLAWALTEAEYALPSDWHEVNAKRLNFQFVNEGNDND